MEQIALSRCSTTPCIGTPIPTTGHLGVFDLAGLGGGDAMVLAFLTASLCGATLGLFIRYTARRCGLFHDYRLVRLDLVTRSGDADQVVSRVLRAA